VRRFSTSRDAVLTADRLAAAAGAAVPPIAAVAVAVIGRQTPGYDPLHRTVSRLAEPGAPYGLAVKLILAALGLSIIAVAWALDRRLTARGPAGALPLGDAARNVAGQRRDPGSVLQFCRSLLALRRAELAGQAAGYEIVPSAEGLWAYRVGGLTVAANFSDAPVDVPGSLAREVLLSTASGAPSASGVIGAWQGTIFRNATPVTRP